MRLTPRFLDGVSLALNTVDGAVAIVDAPRCELERSRFFDATHDWYGQTAGSGPYARDRRIFAPYWTHSTLAQGTEDVLRQLIRFVAERHPHAPILLCPSFLSRLVNTDLAGLIAGLDGVVRNPILLVEPDSIDDDWIDGWRRTTSALWRHLLRPDGRLEPLVAGFCLFRREGDEIGNVLEIERLWQLCGLPSVVWPFNGRPFPFHSLSLQAARLTFPIAWTETDPILPASGVALDLPIGIENTARMLRRLGVFFEHSTAAERVIETECTALQAQLTPFVARVLAGRCAAVVADPWSARGLCDALHELGLDVPLAIVLRRPEASEPDGVHFADAAVEVWVDPPYQQMEDRLRDLAAHGHCNVIVGSALLADAAARLALPYVEITAPHFLEHFAAPSPYMGFRGMLSLAERLTNALLRHEHRSPAGNNRF